MAIEIAGLADIVRIHGARQSASPAIVYEGRTTSYGALDRAASQVANALIAEGVQPQARIAHLDKSILRRANDGRDPTNDQCPSFTGANHLHD